MQSSGVSYNYGPSYGLSFCAAHDAKLPPDCLTQSTSMLKGDTVRPGLLGLTRQAAYALRPQR